MKKVPIDVRRPLPKRILKDAEKEPVLLTVSGKPRYVLRSVAATGKRLTDAELAAIEDEEWRQMSLANLLNAYGEEDAIYDEL